MKKTIKKITKKPVIKRKKVWKKQPALKKEPAIIKEVIVEKPKQPVPVFFGTIYEKEILDICVENKFPFDYRRAKIDGKVADFTNRTKRLVIEVYNPERSFEEVQARLRTFLVERFKTKYITRDKFSMRNCKKVLTVSIKRFLG